MRLAYGDGQDIHIQEFPTNGVSFVLPCLCNVSYLRTSPKSGSLASREPDTFQDSLEISLKVKWYARKCRTSDSDEGHAGLCFRLPGDAEVICDLPTFVVFWCFRGMGAKMNGARTQVQSCGN